MEARAIWHEGNKSWIGPVSSSKNELIIQSLYSLVSHGTERTMITSKLQKEVAEKMAVPYMSGDLNSQFTYGYSLVGRIVEGPKQFVGRVVHLMHPHQDQVTANESDVFFVPHNLDPQIATLASNLETAVNAMWDSEIEMGDHVLIAGYGLIGALLTILIKRMPGVTCKVLESNKHRIELLRKHGHALQPDEDDTSCFDIVFNTTASELVLQKALKITNQEGKIIELSWFGPGKTSLRLGADFHYKRKQIISSQVSNIPIRKQGKWDYRRRKELVFNLLSQLDFSHLLDKVMPFTETPHFYQQLRAGSVKNLGTIIQY